MRMGLFEITQNNTNIKIFHEAKCLGIELVFISKNIAQYPGLERFLKENSIHFLSTDGSIENLAQIAKENELGGMMTLADMAVEQTAAVCSLYKWTHMATDAVRKARNKNLSRQIWNEARVPIPAFRVAYSMEEVIQASEEIGFPCIVKPAKATGGFGVRALHHQKDIQDFFSHLRGPQWWRTKEDKETYLVEEFLEGHVYSTETFSWKGEHQVLGITERHTGGYPHFVGTEFIFPAQTYMAAQVKEVTRKALTALGVDYGPTHTELVISGDDVKVIEVNPRLGGRVIPYLVELASGVSLYREDLKSHLGERPEFLPSQQQVAAGLSFYVPVAGRLLGFPGLQKLQSNPCIQYVKTYKMAGDFVRPPVSSLDLLGEVVIVEKDPDRLNFCLQELRDCMKVSMEIDMCRGSNEQRKPYYTASIL